MGKVWLNNLCLPLKAPEWSALAMQLGGERLDQIDHNDESTELPEFGAGIAFQPQRRSLGNARKSQKPELRPGNDSAATVSIAQDAASPMEEAEVKKPHLLQILMHYTFLKITAFY